jgi:hypothetical protein
MELKEQAKQKLKNEMEKSKDKTFAEQIIPHLLKRCEDDAGLAEDVMQWSYVNTLDTKS